MDAFVIVGEELSGSELIPKPQSPRLSFSRPSPSLASPISPGGQPSCFWEASLLLLLLLKRVLLRLAGAVLLGVVCLGSVGVPQKGLRDLPEGPSSCRLRR